MGKEEVKALAVASEPSIFWRGENACQVIEKIAIPDELGKLIPADGKFNGPSGHALDDFVLRPLGLEREKTWLCDLIPHSCQNSKQKSALERAYYPKIKEHGLIEPSVPELPNPLADEIRREEIWSEIIESGSDTLILLGDYPIKWFLSFIDNRWTKLSDFGKDSSTYGQLHHIQYQNNDFVVLPLTHPRQSGRLGKSSDAWFELHHQWITQTAKRIGDLIH